jgi:TetR/AcrR family transcriptional regulator, fatty acid metabolism regulator protein
VAYGLVYHYFRSKEEVLDTLFTERWDILLGVIRDTDAEDWPPRDKLRAIAAFILDSYRHDPDLMKVIVVEVTRAANSFGLTHGERIREAYALMGDVVAKAQEDGEFRADVTPRFAALAFYGIIEQVLTGWIFEGGRDGVAVSVEEIEEAKDLVVAAIVDGLAAPASTRAV